MTHKQILEKMIELTEELDSVLLAYPYDPDAYEDVMSRINALGASVVSKRRRRPWPVIFLCLAMLCVLLLIVYWILSILWVRSTL